MFWLQKIRKNKGFKAKEVAAKVGLKVSSYSKYETGQRKIPVVVSKKIASILDLDWTMFYGLDDRIECPVCNGLVWKQDNFCSWCGARQYGGETDE